MDDQSSVAGHATSLLTELQQLYERHLLTDLELHTADGQTFNTHKNVLVSFSAYFMGLLNSGQLNSGILYLQNISGSSLEVLLNFMYSGHLNLSNVNAMQVLETAKCLDVVAALILCQDYLLHTLGVEDQAKMDEIFADAGNKMWPDPSSANLPMKVEPLQDLEIKTENIFDVEYLPETLSPEPSGNASAYISPENRQKGRPVKKSAVKRTAKKTKAKQGKPPRRQPRGQGQTKGHSKGQSSVEMKKSPREKTKTVAQEPKHSCRKCNKKFRHWSLCRLHERKHILWSTTGVPRIPFFQQNQQRTESGYFCKKCGQHFRFYSLLRSHHLRQHCQNLKLKCRKCKTVFRSRRLLQIHELRRHKLGLQLRSPGVSVCSRCGRHYKHEALLLKHWQNAHPGLNKEGMCRRKHQCSQCGKTFMGRRKYSQHLKTHGSPPGHVKSTGATEERPWRKNRTWRCEECALTFPIYTKLKSHMEVVHPGISFTCPKCPYNSPVHAMLEVHMLRKHHNKIDCTCEFCGKTFAKRYYLKFHRFSKHNVADDSIKVYRCEEDNCKYVAFTKNLLSQHQLRHRPEKPFTCEDCGLKLKTELNLQKHRNKKHLNIRPWVCDQCGVSYGDQCELKAHIARHSGVKKFKCMLCPFASHDKANLENHGYSVHKVPLPSRRTVYKCEICGLTTRAKTFYTEHMNIHNNIKPFNCVHCGKAFTSKSTMGKHIVWVHSKKEKRCDFCPYVTSTTNHLREHVRIMHTHRDVKPYKCGYCDFRTALSGNCCKHIKNKHKGQAIKWVQICDKFPNNSKPVLGAEHPKGASWELPATFAPSLPVEYNDMAAEAGVLTEDGGQNFLAENFQCVPPVLQHGVDPQLGSYVVYNPS